MFVVRPSLLGQLYNCLKGWVCFCCFLKLSIFALKLEIWQLGDGFAFSFLSVSGLLVGSG